MQGTSPHALHPDLFLASDRKAKGKCRDDSKSPWGKNGTCFVSNEFLKYDVKLEKSQCLTVPGLGRTHKAEKQAVRAMSSGQIKP